MSVDRNVYIGPYTRCESAQGNKPHWDEVAQRIKERLHVYVRSDHPADSDSHIWMPNVAYIGNTALGSVDSEEFRRVTSEMITDETIAYMRAFKPEIDVLREMYVETSSQWGIVAWES